MRHGILIIAFVVSVVSVASFAEEKPQPPKWMQGGTITLTLANGEVKEYKVDDWKIVPRKVYKPKPAKVIVKEVPVVKEVVRDVVKNRFKKNEIALLAGIGPNELEYLEDPNNAEVSLAESVIGGISYTRRLTFTWSVKAQAFLNNTYALGVGYNF